MAAKYSKVEKFFEDRETLYANSILALEQLGFDIRKYDDDRTLIVARTGFTMWSYGERITIQFSDDGNVAVKSECTMPTQLFSWGKNKQNVFRFLEQLAEVGAKNSTK